MKKNPFLLVMLALLLAFSFSVIGCDDGGGNGDKKEGPGGNGGGGIQWPADLIFKTGDKLMDAGIGIGEWGTRSLSADGYVIFAQPQPNADIPALFDFSNVGALAYLFGLVSVDVEGKKFTIKDRMPGSDGKTITLGYTITDEKLTLTGNAADFVGLGSAEGFAAKLLNVPLPKKVD